MKINGLSFKAKICDSESAPDVLAPDYVPTAPVLIDVEVNGGAVIGHLVKNSKDFLNYADIASYKFSSGLHNFFGGDYNTILTLERNNESREYITKLTWMQRQKLYLMMGDHIILNSGNFKWLVGTALTVLFFIYQARQNDKLVAAGIENNKLKDQIHLLESKLKNSQK